MPDINLLSMDDIGDFYSRVDQLIMAGGRDNRLQALQLYDRMRILNPSFQFPELESRRNPPSSLTYQQQKDIDLRICQICKQQLSERLLGKNGQ